jgi:hypothetical protein
MVWAVRSFVHHHGAYDQFHWMRCAMVFRASRQASPGFGATENASSYQFGGMHICTDEVKVETLSMSRACTAEPANFHAVTPKSIRFSSHHCKQAKMNSSDDLISLKSDWSEDATLISLKSDCSEDATLIPLKSDCSEDATLISFKKPESKVFTLLLIDGKQHA